ncbi:hypothetical protein ACO0QE_003076 [Hanseniaspora vineae]
MEDKNNTASSIEISTNPVLPKIKAENNHMARKTSRWDRTDKKKPSKSCNRTITNNSKPVNTTSTEVPSIKKLKLENTDNHSDLNSSTDSLPHASGKSASPSHSHSSTGVSMDSRSEDYSNIHKDGVHEEQGDYSISPGQLYSTDSGRLFHAGKILIVLVGLPATSKTKLSVAITRYTRWLGVKTQAFHASEYRRNYCQQNGIVDSTQNSHDKSQKANNLPPEYFSVCPQMEEAKKYREEILKSCMNDIDLFFKEPNSQLAIYDALNILPQDRQAIFNRFAKKTDDASKGQVLYTDDGDSLGVDDVKVLFIESIVTDPQLLKRNVNISIGSVDYQGWDPELARKNFMQRLDINKKYYQEMTSQENLSFVKYINYGERLIVNNNFYGYLINKIVFFLMNLKEKKGKVFLSRCGTSDNDKYLDDEQLNEEGVRFSKKLTEVVLKRLNEERMQRIRNSNSQHEQKTFDSNTSLNTLAKPLVETNATAQRHLTGGKAQYKQVSMHDGADEDSFIVWTAPRKRTHDTSKFFQQLGIPVRQRNQLKQLHPGIVTDMLAAEIAKKYPHEYKHFLKNPYHYRYPRAESYHDLAVRIEPLLLEIERMCGDVLIIAHESTLRVLYGYLMACTSSDIPNIDFSRNEVIEISFGHYENQATRIPIDY